MIRWMGIGLLMVGCVGAMGQSTLDRPLGAREAYSLDSGELDNANTREKLVYQDLVQVSGAAWLRLHFAVASVPSGGRLRASSLLDGEAQELDASTLTMWGNSTAYFNGGEVLVELFAAPQSIGNRVSISEIEVERLPDGGVADSDDLCGICGVDDRVPSNEEWTGRLMPVGCTAEVFNDRSCLFSAGHCNSGTVIQFRVPSSNATNCNTRNPPVAEQFPITGKEFKNAGVGNDWMIMTTGTNSLGQKPFDRYGQFRPVAGAPAAIGDTAVVFGYGAEDPPDCARNQTQQTHSGPITNRLGGRYEFNIDTTFGNSGSAVLFNDEMIGIVTHCTSECPNIATRIDKNEVIEAREMLCPCVPPAFSTQPASATVCAGGGATLTVSVEGDGNPKYQWRRNGVNLVNGSGISGATSAALTIAAFAPVNVGSYDCVVTTFCGAASSDTAVLTLISGCDANCDGSINQFDITPFITALSTQSGCSACAGDANGDGSLNQFDINAFIDCLVP